MFFRFLFFIIIAISDIKKIEKSKIYKNDVIFEEFIEFINIPPMNRSDIENKMIYNYLQESNILEILNKYKTPDLTKGTLAKIFSENMQRTDLKNNEILFRIDEYGDKFFLIIKGTVMVLKPKKIKKYLTPREFLAYLITLKTKKEK